MLQLARKTIFVLALLYGPSVISQPVKPAVNDMLAPASSEIITGFVGQKLEDSYQRRILAQDVNRIIAPFNSRNEDKCWQTEFWGKWITSAILAYNYNQQPQLKKVIDDAVTRLIASQTADGYIGNYREDKRLEQWDIWGRKYCMLGLLAYYDITKDAKSLTAARKVADHLMKELSTKNVKLVTTGNHRGMASTSVIEPIVLLYARTNDKRYLDFANEIVQQWESPQGPQLIAKSTVNVGQRFPIPEVWFNYDQGQKAYEMMSCYEGLLELYRITGTPSYLDAVKRVWDNINDTEINIVGSGAARECWFGGKKLQTESAFHYQETCVTATWIKLSQQLLRLTGEPKYADAIELSLYNGLLGSMTPSGASWAKYSPIMGVRTEGSDQCEMGINCCIASGPRGLFTIPSTTVMKSPQGAIVNFFIPGTYRFITPAKQTAELLVQTDYPSGGKISYTLKLPKPEDFNLQFRIPAWSAKSTLELNGSAAPAESGKLASLKRSWKSGDAVTLTLDMRGRLETIKGAATDFEAIHRGPVVLARDKRLPDAADVDEVISPVVDKDGFVQVDQVTAPNSKDTIWMRFKVPCMIGSYRREATGSPLMLSFCDYASAGNTYTEDSRFRIWLPQLLDPQKLVTK